MNEHVRNDVSLEVLPGILAAALALTVLGLTPAPSLAQEAGHGRHGAHEGPPEAEQRQEPNAPLERPGNAAFAAIQEVVRQLEATGDTDWSRVDLEALRRHLQDMRRFTLEAEVVEREPVDGGLRVAVTGASPEASASVRRALRAHAPMLEEETGWSVSVEARDERTVLRVTSGEQEGIERIRGLGYIGLMATGAHHQRHHWMIATGRSPHQR